jgi:hypothetical protein
MRTQASSSRAPAASRRNQRRIASRRRTTNRGGGTEAMGALSNLQNLRPSGPRGDWLRDEWFRWFMLHRSCASTRRGTWLRRPRR